MSLALTALSTSTPRSRLASSKARPMRICSSFNSPSSLRRLSLTFLASSVLGLSSAFLALQSGISG